MSKRIEILDSKTWGQLRTDVIIQSVENCVAELIENSLDAEASSIAVRINLYNFKIQVIDNGTGITKTQMEKIGKRYYTTKSKSLEDLNDNQTHIYGFRGETLASIKNCCERLLIISKYFASCKTYCKEFLAGNKGNMPVISRHDRACKGTTIVVDNLFYNREIRKNFVTPSAEFLKIERHIKALALIYPKVNFSLRDYARDADVLSIKRTGSCLATFLMLYPDVADDESNFVQVSSKLGTMQGKAYVCKRSHGNSSLQFVFFNRRNASDGELRRLVDKNLSQGCLRTNRELDVGKAIFMVDLRCGIGRMDAFRPMGFDLASWKDVRECVEILAAKVKNIKNGKSSVFEDIIQDQGEFKNTDARKVAILGDDVRVTYGYAVTRNMSKESLVQRDESFAGKSLIQIESAMQSKSQHVQNISPGAAASPCQNMVNRRCIKEMKPSPLPELVLERKRPDLMENFYSLVRPLVKKTSAISHTLKVPSKEVKVKKLVLNNFANEDAHSLGLKEMLRAFSLHNDVAINEAGISHLKISNAHKKKDSKKIEAPYEGIVATFKKDDVHHFQFLSQIEDKLLLGILRKANDSNSVVFVIDQHGLHERIRAEMLQKCYKTCGGNWIQKFLEQEVILQIGPEDVAALVTYPEQLLNIGLGYEQTRGMERNFVSIRVLPLCFYNKLIKRFGSEMDERFEGAVADFVKKVVDEVSKCGFISEIHADLNDIVNSEACQGAIQFGEKLTEETCQNLLYNMRLCESPFQCAHGRPIVHSLLNLASILKTKKTESVVQKPLNLQSIARNM